MRRGWPRTAAIAALGLLAPLVSPAPGAEAGLRRTANVLPVAMRSHPAGAPDASRPMSIAIVLASPRPAEQRALAAAVVDPADPRYHRFLTPRQYADAYGLPQAVQDRVREWLRHGGLRVTYASPLGDVVAATGTAAQLERLFHVRLQAYRLGVRNFVANDEAPAVPSDLPVTDVIGLNDLERFVPLESRTADPGPTAFHVRDLWKAYDVPARNGGDGVEVGVIMAGNPKPVVGSLRVFEDAEGLPRVPVRTVDAGAGPVERYANTAASEWMLDAQAATGMAPRVSRLDLYTAPSLAPADVVSVFSRWANDPRGAALMSASIAYCEAVPFDPPPLEAGGAGVEVGNRVQAGVERALMQAFIEGRTLFAGAGDSGSSCQLASLPVIGSGNGQVNQVVPLQGYPASSPYATAVGGTVLDLGADGTRRDERAWAFTGGGAALFIPRPDWQRREPAVDRPCLLTDSQGGPLPPGTVCRGVPDLAALSGNASQGMAVRVYDAPETVRGTSLSTPLAMGMWARVVAAAGRPLGPAAPALYGLDAARRASAFHDVTEGEFLGNGAYLTGPGWDYTSGYGVPDVARLAALLGGRTEARRQVAPAPVPEAASDAPAHAGDACLPIATSPAGNVDTTAFGDDTLDITAVSMASGGDSLAITVTGPRLDLSPTPPGAPSSVVRVQWAYGGAAWVAQAATDSVGLTAVGGRLGGPADIRPVTAVTRPGVLTITVPLAGIGSPRAGTRLRYPVALSGVTAGTDVTEPVDIADVAGPDRDHLVGGRCR